jgi:hypothetical protein
MHKRKLIYILFLSLPALSHTYSQSFVQPNFALKSHETLEITKVEITPEKTTISLRIENRIEGGSFCADKNVYIIYPEGNRVRLVRADGIPVCPENFIFRSVGEKLDFSLVFPSLKPGTEWIDVIEECSANCFWFYGITLNNDLNKKLDEAFTAASKGKPGDNILLFRNILEDVDNQDLGIEGLLFINIINAAIENGDKVEAAVWYKRFLSSHAPRLNQYVKYLNDKGIKF